MHRQTRRARRSKRRVLASALSRSTRGIGSVYTTDCGSTLLSGERPVVAATTGGGTGGTRRRLVRPAGAGSRSPFRLDGTECRGGSQGLSAPGWPAASAGAGCGAGGAAVAGCDGGAAQPALAGVGYGTTRCPAAAADDPPRLLLEQLVAPG